jgi:hypothetical protein
MRTIHLLVILLALTARNATAAALRTTIKDRITGKFSPWKTDIFCVLTLATTSSALTHTPERVGFFGRNSELAP